MLLNLFKISRLQLLATPMSRGFRPPGRRRVQRPAAGDQEDCGEAGRGNPVYHGESVRDRLFGDIEPVVGEHVVERLAI